MDRYFKIIVFSLLAVLGFGITTASAQQDPIYNQYMFNPLVLNPAYAGSRDGISAVALHRSQWTGLDGAPKTQTIAVHSPFMQKKVGLGLIVAHDAIGAINRTGITGAYAYRLKTDGGNLAFGISTTAYNFVFDWDKVEYKDSGDPLYGTGKVSGWVPAFDFALRYSTNKFYAGINFMNLNNPKLGFLENDTIGNGGSGGLGGGNSGPKLNRHLNITAGKAFVLNDNFVLRPSVMVRAEPLTAPVADLNVSVLIKEALWIGTSFRSSKAMVFIAEYSINKKYRAGYSYDISLSELRTVNSGSHEIFIGIEFPSKPHFKLLSPRVYF